jgi:glycerol-3-phosphate dehydrogenase
MLWSFSFYQKGRMTLMSTNFSSLRRSEYLEEMEKETLDVLVIGGGITGAGIALDAQVRGLKTGLVEMQDFAGGTSSRSTKLVHGGLRYLKQFEIKLVAEVGKERAIVYENAPHVTTPIWMILPIFELGTFDKYSTSIGLKIYDWLARVKKSERRKMLNLQQTQEREPLLRSEGLKGSGFYVEYQTDDARLTLEVLKEAVNRGALAVNYTKVDNFIYSNGRVIGVHVVDRISGKVYKIHAKNIVNATGPWVDELREKDKSKYGKYIHWTKGVHLVIDKKRFPLQEAVYFDTPFKDGRMMFAIPRDKKTYIGTTDTNYHDNPINPRMTEEDCEYILSAANNMFPNLRLSKDDVDSSWAGLRPLIHEEGKSPSEISRKDEIFLSQSGLITIAGGKLTGYRKMAEKVVDLIANKKVEEEGKKISSCTTDQVILSGGDVGGSNNFSLFIKDYVNKGIDLGLSKDDAEMLIKRFGSNIKCIYEIINSRKIGEQADLPLELYSSLVYGIQKEMVMTLTDFFIRRTATLLFDIEYVHEWKEKVSQFMNSYLNWTKEQEYLYREELEKELYLAASSDLKKENIIKKVK